jgi:hypothetical protein
MSFFVPPSPTAAESPSRNSPDEDILSSALHSALHPFTSSHQSTQTAGDHESIPEKLKTGLEIIFNPEIVCLKGTGPDVEPALLSGHVALYLTESTSIKEITLSFRGKARLPPAPSHEP